MNKEMIDLYEQLDISNKRNEFSSLLMKIDGLLNTIMDQQGIQNDISVKNYNKDLGTKLSEDKTLTFFYEDLWNLKNKILLIISLNNNK